MAKISMVGFAVVVALVPSTAWGVARYVDGTAGADTIRFGQVWVSGESAYHWYSCVNGSWTDEGL